MTIAMDVLVIGAALMLIGLAVYSRFSVKCIFWPPPDDGSWKRFATLSLFRTMFYGLVAISIYRAVTGGSQSNIWLFPAAVFLTVFGLGKCLWRQTRTEDDGDIRPKQKPDICDYLDWSNWLGIACSASCYLIGTIGLGRPVLDRHSLRGAMVTIAIWRRICGVFKQNAALFLMQ